MTEKKVLVVVDGYNLYYSVCDFVPKYLDGKYLWYDLFRLIQPHIKEGEIIDKLYYCSAAYESPGSQEQQKVQKIYMKHHADTYGEKFVSVMGRFSRSGDAGYCCPHCKKQIPKQKPYKEKETDVNIALKTTVSICRNTYPKIILVSGDTDFEPLFEFATEEQTEMLRLLPPSSNTRFRDPKHLLITGEHIQAACFADQVPPGTPEPRRYPEDGGPPSGSAPPPEPSKPPDDPDDGGAPSGSAPPPDTAETSAPPPEPSKPLDDPDDGGAPPGTAPLFGIPDPSDAPDA